MPRSSARPVGGAVVLVAAGLALGFTPGCGPPQEQPWQLTGFRVLGIRADAPEPARGDSFTLTLATADTRARDVQVLWLVCANNMAPGAGSGALSVTGACGMDAQQTGVGATATFHVPATGGTLNGSGNETLSVVGFSCAGGTLDLTVLARPDAGPESLGMVCRGTDAQGWLFTGEVPIHGPTSLDPTAPNHNPTITAVRLSGAALDDAAPPHVARCTDQSSMSTCPQLPFDVAFSADSREPFHTRDAVTGAVTADTERLTVGFTITGGKLEAGFRGDTRLDPTAAMTNNWRAPEMPGTYQLYVWALDGRGGFATTHRAIQVD